MRRAVWTCLKYTSLGTIGNTDIALANRQRRDGSGQTQRMLAGLTHQQAVDQTANHGIPGTNGADHFDGRRFRNPFALSLIHIFRP